MSKIFSFPLGRIASLFSFMILFLALTQCAEEEILQRSQTPADDVAIQATAISPSTCSCNYVVPSNAYVVDGIKLGLKPGSTICLKAGNIYKSLVFRNIKGTATYPITITNCGGTATVNASGLSVAIRMEYSQHFRISGGTGSTYGLRIISGHNSVSLEKLSTNFQIDHVEISNSGFAGIMAKTDPTCDLATTRGYFTMRNVSLHHNYIHDTGGEAFYVGHSFYSKGVSLSCGVRLPHTIEGLRIHDNKVINSGWEAIQVGCAIAGAYVYNNHVENYGKKNVKYQNNGIQFSEGTKAILYNNFIKNGPGIGVNVVGHGDAFLHDNIIVNAGTFGIFADERTSIGPGMRIINNTIINPKQDGIRLYTDLVTNVVRNNVIVNPGSYSKYTYPRTGNDAYVYLLTKTMNVQMSNNYLTRSLSAPKFVNPWSFNYRLASGSPLINKGANISTYSISKDFYQQARLKGYTYDIGASEY